MGDPPFGPLGGHFADAILHLLKALADDTDNVDGDLRIAVHQIEQFGLAPACLQSFAKSYRVGRISAIGEQRHGTKHFAGANEADHHLGAVAA
jgi:hypothetical protein